MEGLARVSSSNRRHWLHRQVRLTMKIESSVHGDAEYAQKLRAFFNETGKELSTGLRQESRLMAVSLAHETQPYGNDKSAQALGQAAVNRDVRRLFATPQEAFALVLAQDGQALADEFYVLTSQGKPADAQALLQNKSGSKVRGVPIADTPDPAIHRAGRMSNGRARNRISQIVLNPKARDRYIKQKQRLVGFAKSGWATCARILGGTRGIPGWVSRNKGGGTVSDNSRALLNPSVTLKNTVSYIDKVLPASGVANAFAVGRNRAKKMMDIALSKARAKAKLKGS